MCRFGTQPKRVPNAAQEILSPTCSVKEARLRTAGFTSLRLAAPEGNDVARRADLEDGVVGRSGDAVGHVPGEEGERIARRRGCQPVDADLAERRRLAPILVVPSL